MTLPTQNNPFQGQNIIRLESACETTINSLGSQQQKLQRDLRMKGGQIKFLMDTQALLFERLTGVEAKEKERESAQALLIERLMGVEERLKVIDAGFGADSREYSAGGYLDGDNTEEYSEED
ncbi:hypothetical protein TL16_g09428 [Triparma laevis f. inornata]|uniref:Uncharacterized protein n=1 Tax=Triparma laevis f. inornata TaxID=1714386 RepID=A0A9W7EMU0_9STRA|nr:hypothetical protein TL16_g09428 [Triparma laevis f. inornata]